MLPVTLVFYEIGASRRDSAEHKPYSENELKPLLIEPLGMFDTGNEGGERTAENVVWI
jgi:hypothetical protein